MEIRTPDEKFYGRIKSRALTQRQILLFDKLSGIFISSINDVHFDNKELFLEIGFGSGEHIAQMAVKNPDKVFIGCEPFINGIASLLGKIDDNNIRNIFIFQGDARIFMKESPNDFYSGVFLLFPDPWPKRRHIRRRFIQEKTILEMGRILKKGTYWRIASDQPEYKKWILNNFSKDPAATIFSYETFNALSRPSEEIWPKTRYEKKATEDILYLIAFKSSLSTVSPNN
ncbi:MAG: tRNA (guanosine(46)-N7)-methyltransferase TrmB [Holosporales bacterium]|jgi:tRNA (guanine-N7-)-methyltransferase|nr:tRNA (guanosine(46)-N7)-methyltransferase TrmB [Holosporales bacterium]